MRGELHRSSFNFGPSQNAILSSFRIQLWQKKDGEEERSLHLIGQRQNEGNVRVLLNLWRELKVHVAGAKVGIRS
jgi:hypothetical protein